MHLEPQAARFSTEVTRKVTASSFQPGATGSLFLFLCAWLEDGCLRTKRIRGVAKRRR